MLSYRSAPPIVGREALLDYAVEDFISEITRQKPWRRARYETLLESLEEHVSAALTRPAPVSVLNQTGANTWLQTLPTEQRPLAEEVLRDFSNYLVAWNWLEVHPLERA